MSDCGCEGLRYVGRFGREMRWADWLTITPDDEAAHTAGDVVSGELAFTCTTLSTGGTARITELVFIERGDAENPPQKAALTLMLYTAPQAGGMPALAAQNAAYVAPNDPTILIGRIEIKDSDWKDVDAVTAMVILSLDTEIKAAPGQQTIWGVLTTPGTPTWTDTEVQTLYLQLRIARD